MEDVVCPTVFNTVWTHPVQAYLHAPTRQPYSGPIFPLFDATIVNFRSVKASFVPSFRISACSLRLVHLHRMNLTLTTILPVSSFQDPTCSGKYTHILMSDSRLAGSPCSSQAVQAYTAGVYPSSKANPAYGQA